MPCIEIYMPKWAKGTNKEVSFTAKYKDEF